MSAALLALLGCGAEADRPKADTGEVDSETELPDSTPWPDTCAETEVSTETVPSTTAGITLDSYREASSPNRAISADASFAVVANRVFSDGENTPSSLLVVDAHTLEPRWTWSDPELDDAAYRFDLGTPESNGLTEPVVAVAYWGTFGTTDTPHGTVLLDADGAVLADIVEEERSIGYGTTFVDSVVVLGAPGAGGTWFADTRMYVFSGEARGDLGPEDALAMHENSATLDPVGMQVHRVGDVDGDGQTDVVMVTNAGGVFLRHEDLLVDNGADAGIPLPLWIKPGRSAVPAGDHDGDGLGDFAFGYYDATMKGEVAVAGRDGVLATVGDERDIAGSWLGNALAPVGDPDGDGHDAFVAEEWTEGDEPDPGAELWLLEGPLCGAVSLQEVGVLIETDPAYVYQQFPSGAPGLLALDRYDDSGIWSIHLWSW